MTLKKFCSLFFATSRILFSADLSFYESFKMVPLLDGRDLWGNYCIQPTMVSENGLTKKDYTDRRVEDIESFFRNIQENWKTLNRQDVVQQFSQVNQLANAVHFSALHFFEMVLQSTHISEMKIERMERQNRRAQLFHRIRELKGSFIASQQSINKTKNVARINTVLHIHGVFNALLLCDGVKEGDYDLYAKRIVSVLADYCGKSSFEMMNKLGVGLFYRYRVNRLETPTEKPLTCRQKIRHKLDDYRREIQFYLSLSDPEFHDFCHYILHDVPLSDCPTLTESMKAVGLSAFKSRDRDMLSIYLCDDTLWAQRLLEAQNIFNGLEHRRLQGEDLSSLITGYWDLSRNYDFAPCNLFLALLFQDHLNRFYGQEWGIFFSMAKPQTLKHMEDIRRAVLLRRTYYISLPRRDDAYFIEDEKDPIVLLEGDRQSVSSDEHAATANTSFPSHQGASHSSPHSSASDDENPHNPLVSVKNEGVKNRFSNPQKASAHSFNKPELAPFMMFEQGEELLKKKQVEEGLSLMEKAVSAMPSRHDWKQTFLKALMDYHHTLYMTQNIPLTTIYVQWLESIAPKYADYKIWRFMGKIFEGVRFDAFYNPQKAITAYQKAINVGDSSGLSHLYLGRQQRDISDYKEALLNLDFAAEKNVALAKFELAIHYLGFIKYGNVTALFTQISKDGLTYDDEKVKESWVKEAQTTFKEGLTLLKSAHDAGHPQAKMVFALYYGFYLKSINQTTITKQDFQDLVPLFTDASAYFNIPLLLPQNLTEKPLVVAFMYHDIHNPLSFPLAFCFERSSFNQWNDFLSFYTNLPLDQKTRFQNANASTVYNHYHILKVS